MLNIAYPLTLSSQEFKYFAMKSTRDKIATLRAANPGLPGTAMAVLLGVSKQRIYQILAEIDAPRRAYRRGGPRKAPEWRCWYNMIHRCTNPNSDLWKWYGGRGIEICTRWLTSYENFIADMGPRPSPHHSIDRINNDGNYEPKNCRWATRAEQQANKHWGGNRWVKRQRKLGKRGLPTGRREK